MPVATPPARAAIDPALVVILAGVCAALHVGKLPPAIAALQDALGLTLLQAGFLLSLVQVAGMSVGVAFGAVADALGLRRSMLCGLLVLAGASALGGWAQGVPALMALRALEGFGFLLVVLPAPGLVRQLVAPPRMGTMLGFWSAYMPLATTLALLLGPICIALAGWRAWWWLLAGVSAAMALWLARAVPAPAPDRPAPTGPGAGGPAPGQPAGLALGSSWLPRLRQTLAVRGIWLAAMMFALYAGQWLAVIGFLPVIAAQAHLSAAALGVLSALAAAVNIAGNLAAGRWLNRGTAPARLLRIGFVTMGLATLAAFAGEPATGLPPALRYAAVLVFSMCGGLIPATLFALALHLAPSEQTLATTAGWVQQWSAFGQFAGPPLVAWVASSSGGWQWTWLVTGSCSLLGLLLAGRVAGARR
jgi:MFS transporter, CP family, cyanate transporter